MQCWHALSGAEISVPDPGNAYARNGFFSCYSLPHARITKRYPAIPSLVQAAVLPKSMNGCRDSPVSYYHIGALKSWPLEALLRLLSYPAIVSAFD